MESTEKKINRQGAITRGHCAVCIMGIDVGMNIKWLYLILILALLPACGQKGPLFLPEEAAPDTPSEKTAAVVDDSAHGSANESDSDKE